MGRELPNNWVGVKFTDVLDIKGGSQPPKSQFISEPKAGYVRLLQIRDFGSKPVPTYIPVIKNQLMCSAEDILIARYGASIGRIVSGMQGSYNVALAKVIIPSLISKNFVKYYLKSSIFQNPITTTQRTAQNGFNKEDLDSVDFPLPSFAEQERIVAKLDALFAQYEAIKQPLEHIPQLLKDFRQQVLTQAVTGKLTEKWRVGKELESWKLKKLKEVCFGFKYGSSAKSDDIGKVAVLRMGNLQNGKLDLSDLKFSNNEAEIKKYCLKNGDVLFNRTNSPELVGKTSIYKNQIPAVYAGYLIKIENDQSKLVSEYLNYFMNTNQVKIWCNEVKSDGVSQSNINAQKLSNLKIPLPPMLEQQEIVYRIESFSTKADKIEEKYKALKAKVATLLQAILHKAFKGELVAQLPTDGDANDLLEEIKALKEKVKKK